MLKGETVANVFIGKHGSGQIAHDLGRGWYLSPGLRSPWVSEITPTRMGA